jgi:hypothetical protein
VNVAEQEQVGRRRRGWIIVAVAIFLVVAPLSLNWWFEQQAAEQAEDVAEKVRVGARSITEEDMQTLRSEELSGGGSGGYAGALGLEDEWKSTAMGNPVRIVFEACSGWAARCVHAVLAPGAADTEITVAPSEGCAIPD